MDAVELSKAEALALLSAPPYDGVLFEAQVVGDVDPSLVREVLGTPTGRRRYVRAEAINAGDATVLALNEFAYRVVVGPKVQAVTPRLHVALPGEWLTFEADGRVFRRGVADVDTAPLSDADTSHLLVAFDGHSVESSLERATAPRRAMLDWLAGGARPARSVLFAYKAHNGLFNLCVVAGMVGVALFLTGFIYPHVRVFSWVGFCGLIFSVLAYGGVRSLRGFFGLPGVGFISRT